MTLPKPDPLLTEDSSLGHVRSCLNCGAPAPGSYCPECGQETARDAQSLAGWLQGSLARTLARRGRLWLTLSKLFFVPGALTAEYNAGRRARYLRPLQLYLAASVIVFACVQFFGLSLSLRVYGEQGVHLLRNTPIAFGADHAQGQRLTAVQIVLDHIDTPGVRRFLALPLEERFTLLRARRARYVSYLVLFLVPVVALTLGLFYRDRRRHYVEHLVFGLHCQTFLLFALLVESTLPAILANAMSFWVIAYFTVALKRVYGGTWVETLGRGSVILALYFGIYFVANLLLVVALLAL